MNCDIYQYEIFLNTFFQKNFLSYSKIFFFINDCFNVKVFFHIFLPILAGLDKDLFLMATISGLIADYLNSFMKWFFAEPRPHWWVRGGYRLARLSQFEKICECSPGSPSSELMVSAAVLFVLISSSCKTYERQISDCWKKLIWMFYIALLVLQTSSQLFLGVHFFHQCLLGAIFGTLVGSFVTSPKIFGEICNISKLRSSAVILGMFLAICGAYWIQIYFGLDPNWSTILAFKYCENDEAIRPEFLLMYFLMRNMGIFIGILSYSPLNKCRPHISNTCISTLFNIPKMIIGSIILRNLPHNHGVYTFYGCTVAFHAIYYFLLYKNFH